MNGLNEMGNNEIEIERLSTPIMKIVNNLLFSKNVIKRKKTVSKKSILFQINKSEDTSSEPTFSYIARLSR